MYGPSIEMKLRDGESVDGIIPECEINESAYRRGFQHGVVAMKSLLAEMKINSNLLHGISESEYVSCKMRYDRKPYQNKYLHVFVERMRKILCIKTGQ